MTRYNIGGTAKVGDAAEAEFARVAVAQGFRVKKSGKIADKYRHIDYYLKDGEDVFSVDVKSRKKLSRRDSEYCDDWVYVEFRLPEGYPGWLYSESTDYFAFEGPDDFFVVERVKLLELAEAMVDLTQMVDDPHDAKYVGFCRQKQELVALVQSEWVRLISTWIWPK